MIANSTLSRFASIWISFLIYIVAAIVAVLVGRLYMDYHPLVMIGAGDLAATIVVFIFSIIMNNSSAYDPYWSVKPIVIALAYVFIFQADMNIRQWLVLIGTTLYAIRLTSNFYRDWPGFKHEDWRYVNIRKTSGKAYWLVSFLGIHLFPTIMVYLGCLALFAVFSADGRALNIWDLVGIVILYGSVIYAFVADEQMRNFRRIEQNRGKAMTTGLWKLCRHPNYLGEISTWWGLAYFAIAAGCSYWWTLAGPVAITLLFSFVSIPLIERRNLDRRLGYREYMIRTPKLMPMRFRK